MSEQPKHVVSIALDVILEGLLRPVGEGLNHCLELVQEQNGFV